MTDIASQHEQERFAAAEKRLQSLERLDDANGAGGWNWFTFRTILTSGAGFFTDSYDVFIINLVTPMLGYVYYSQHGNKIPSNIEGILKGMSSVGTFIGQLLFGFLGDILGRKIYGFELLIIIIGTINCATSASAIRGVDAIAFLGFWRLILGIGVGGDYPMSATITSEWSAAGKRGMMMALIFSMQGIGNLSAAIVTLILLAIFKGAINADVMNLDYVWRLCIGLGAVPAVATIYLRFTMPESPRYSLNVQGDVEAAAQAKGQTVSEELIKQHTKTEEKRDHWAEFRAYFGQWKHLRVLIGTAASWFLLDVAFYGLGLNNSAILQAIGFAHKATPFETLWANTVGQIIITCLGSVPGYYITVFTVEKLGRRTIQIMGFTATTILFAIMAGCYNILIEKSMPAFIFLFTLAQLFQNFGANATTFIIPGEVFPTKVRASAHGISAASGKAGAILASFAFNVLVDIGGAPGQHAFLPQTLGIFAAVMFLGLIVTVLWVPESKGKDLEEFEEDYIPPVTLQLDASEEASTTNEAILPELKA
ncbi:major facilitator superfamily domain-containing protein [Mycotypha africana]|uniref:major facilitator superfamily domain-containing protein n=1 Tax=Mycotypha africana TaxID=64632 RepID=UPI0023005BC3|nr:major facilitator superfamily domain-containing protein [Mycotypha africana]KAI8991983.1 major facilitator superfamily domain-containing protein [Mycotypha africana]